jgi:putative IMPACT (imprinted ancient) family translation regulator
VNGAHVIEVRPSLEVDVVIDFAQEAKARHLLNQHQGKILDVNYAAQVTLHLSLDAESLAAFSQQLINETSGAAQIRRRD